jgi:ribosome-binding protein aMBF1 (putative translation factor)
VFPWESGFGRITQRVRLDYNDSEPIVSACSGTALQMTRGRPRREDEEGMTITPGQTKAARELLGWSHEVLAACLGVSGAAVALFETSGRLSKNLHRQDIQEILEAAGVEFLAGGVMLRKAGRA